MTVTVEPEASVMTPLKAEDVLENDESLEVPMVITEPLLSVVVLKVSVEDSVEPPLVVQVQVEFHSITVLPSMVVHQAVVGEEPLKDGSREETVIDLSFYNSLCTYLLTLTIGCFHVLFRIISSLRYSTFIHYTPFNSIFVIL